MQAAGLRRLYKLSGALTLPSNGIGILPLAVGYGIPKEAYARDYRKNKLIGREFTPEEKEFFDKGYAATNPGKFQRHLGGALAGLNALSLGVLGATGQLSKKAAMQQTVGIGLGLGINYLGNRKLKDSLEKLYEREGLER